MRIPAIAVLTLTLLAAPAFADEVWTTPIGDVVYVKDLATGEAILSYPADDTGQLGYAYIDGLAGNYTTRGAYTGIWIENDIVAGEACNVSIADPETGQPRNNWGRVELIFTEPDYPGGFVAIRGDCFDEPSDHLIAKPVVASP